MNNSHQEEGNAEPKGNRDAKSSAGIYWFTALIIMVPGSFLFVSLKGYSLSSGLGQGYLMGVLIESFMISLLALAIGLLFRGGRTAHGVSRSVLIGSLFGLLLKFLKLFL